MAEENNSDSKIRETGQMSYLGISLASAIAKYGGLMIGIIGIQNALENKSSLEIAMGLGLYAIGSLVDKLASITTSLEIEDEIMSKINRLESTLTQSKGETQ